MVGYNPGSASLHPGVACISHHLAVEARDKPVITSLRLPAVLTVLFKYASLLKKWGARRPVPRTDSPLTHFSSPRGEKCRLGLPSLLRGCGGRLGVLVEGDEVPLRGGRLEYALLSINKERPGLSGSPQARCIRVTSSSGRRTSRSGRMLAGTHVEVAAEKSRRFLRTLRYASCGSGNSHSVALRRMPCPAHGAGGIAADRHLP